MARINQLFEELIPVTGKADSLAGEIIRAANRIGYRFYNDGDMIGIGYGNQTCNAPARFLIVNLPKKISGKVAALWGLINTATYETIMNELLKEIVDYVDSKPELRNQPAKDMWDFRKPEDEEEYDEDY